MTVIEFFDKTAIENMLSALLCRPDKVIFVGFSNKQLRSAMEIYREVLAERCLEPELTYKAISRNDLSSIVDSLTQLVEENEDCVFNLDGGEDLYLVAVGILAERYGSRIQLHRFNVRSKTIIDCDADGITRQEEPIAIRAEENIRIYGGRVIHCSEREGTTFPWVFNEEFREDVLALWEICRQDTRLWNRMLTVLGQLINQYVPEDQQGLDITFPTDTGYVDNSEIMQLKVLLRRLEGAGLLVALEETEGQLSFSYKNNQLRQAMEKAGTALELYVAVLARGIIEDDERLYNDVVCGVWVDWDGTLQEHYIPDVYNEIDLILMHGAAPVFISCKNGMMDTDELYKLITVARRFGGKYAKMALITSSLNELGEKGKYIRTRAAEMEITIIDDVDFMTEKELSRAIASLWCQ